VLEREERGGVKGGWKPSLSVGGEENWWWLGWFRSDLIVVQSGNTRIMKNRKDQRGKEGAIELF